MPTCSLSSDPRGWPVIGLPAASVMLRCHLWPVSWWQYEQALAEPRNLRPRELDRCYAEARDLVTRPRLDQLRSADRSAIAVRGLRPAEAARYAAWLGHGWRLPRDAEWRMIYDQVESAANGFSAAQVLEACASGPPFARAVCARILDTWAGAGPVPLAELMLLDGNFLEWVERASGGPAGRGRQQGSGAAYLCWPRDPRPVELLTADRRAEFRFRCLSTTS